MRRSGNRVFVDAALRSEEPRNEVNVSMPVGCRDHHAPSIDCFECVEVRSQRLNDLGVFGNDQQVELASQDLAFTDSQSIEQSPSELLIDIVNGWRRRKIERDPRISSRASQLTAS